MAIRDEDIQGALKGWGDALISISKTFEDGGIEPARALASDILDAAYGYDLGPVLFKPTLSGGEQTFRTTKHGALSYFVGHDDAYPQDGGFGIMGWCEVKMETAAQFVEGDVAMWMGWVHCINKDGKVTKVDKTFGYKQGADGNLKIVLHHSSLPYQG